MHTLFQAIWTKHRFFCAVVAGAIWRLGAGYMGLGLWNAGHDHLHMLKLAQTQGAAVAQGLGEEAGATAFGDRLLRPLMAAIIAGLKAAHLAHPEELVLAVGILTVVLRAAVMLGLWRIARGFFGASKLRHRAWVMVGLLQGALGTVLLGGVLALGQTPQAQLMVALREDAQARAVIALGAPLEAFFLGERPLPLAAHDTLDERWLRMTLMGFERAQTPANRFVFFAADRDKSEVMLILEGLSCPEPELFLGSWLDRLAVALDPVRHKSRAARLAYRCSGTDVASVAPNMRPMRLRAHKR